GRQYNTDPADIDHSASVRNTGRRSPTNLPAGYRPWEVRGRGRSWPTGAASHALDVTGDLAWQGCRGTAQVIEEIVIPHHDGERLVVGDMLVRTRVKGRECGA